MNDKTEYIKVKAKKSCILRIQVYSSNGFSIAMAITLLSIVSLLLCGAQGRFSQTNDLAQLPEGGPPPAPVPRRSSATCGCKRLLLSSLGPAAHYQPQAMGIYEL